MYMCSADAAFILPCGAGDTRAPVGPGCAYIARTRAEARGAHAAGDASLLCVCIHVQHAYTDGYIHVHRTGTYDVCAWLHAQLAPQVMRVSCVYVYACTHMYTTCTHMYTLVYTMFAPVCMDACVVHTV